MLYNKERGRAKATSDCFTCKYFNQVKKRCEGIGKNCFEYDPKTMTVYDPITKMPIKIKGKGE